MNHRIRAAALIVKDDTILLVKHVHPVTKFEWWVPPGGKIEDTDMSIFEAVGLEVFPEIIKEESFWLERRTKITRYLG